jgi:predicted nuclease of predicted toxin-antitoxin system
MAIRFQADADFNQIIVSAVVRRNPQIDIRTAAGANLAGLKDPDVLAVAARENRVLVTHDHKTMPRHFAEFVRTAASPGLIVVSQTLPVREVADDLILIWAAAGPDELVNRITYLPI